MKIIIIRHGEPDNEHNTLTEQGFKEVASLGEFYRNAHFDKVYVSPLARAQLTAEGLLRYHNSEMTTLPWLAEFVHYVTIPETGQKVLNWDFLPEYYYDHPDLQDNQLYLDTPLLQSANMKEEYQKVVTSFDKVLSEHGYHRDGKIYRVEKANTNTIVFVCHFGMMGVILSHLMNVPYLLFTQFFACAPTGVTILNSEERQKGKAIFRCSRYGDISHLNLAAVTPSKHCRFCEIYDSDERH